MRHHHAQGKVADAALSDDH